MSLDASGGHSRIIAEVTSRDGWDGLIEGLRKAFDQLGTTWRVGNDIAGLAEGHLEKIFAPIPIKGLGRRTFGPVLGACGAKILIVVDETALAFVRQHNRFRPRKGAVTRAKTAKKRKANQRLRQRRLLPPELARMMRARQVLQQSGSERSAIARKAAVIRWERVKAAVKASPSPASG